VAYDSLSALAARALLDGVVWAAQPGRRGEVYARAFAVSPPAPPRPLGEIEVVAVAEAAFRGPWLAAEALDLGSAERAPATGSTAEGLLRLAAAGVPASRSSRSTWRARRSTSAGSGRVTRASLRVPQPGDLKAMAEAEVICFADPWPSQLLASELLAPGRFHRVAVDPGGRLVAYLLAACSTSTCTCSRSRCCRTAGGRGWRGSSWTWRSVTRGDGGESVTLEVRDSNRPAASLYAALGFELVGRRPAYYTDGEDALIMTKRVPA